LIETMVACLTTGDAVEDRAAQRRHGAIMRRFHAVLEANDDQALYIPEICETIGVSERTLRVCCQEHLGVSPKRFLLLRADAPGSTCAARKLRWPDNGDGSRHAIRLLAIRTLRRRIQLALRRIAVRRAPPSRRIAAERRSLIFPRFGRN
jgi:AraC-like DNA-binding protein